MSCVYNGTTSTFPYGADGLRRSSTVSGVTTYYVYDGQTLVREMQRNAQTNALYNTATYLQGARGSECRIDETQQTEGYYNPADASPRSVHARGVTKWYVYDGLGSVVGETDFNGNLTSSPKYDVYGLVRSNPGTASSKMGFVGGLGHLSEANTGLIYMRARYYDPQQGRFESEDSSGSGINWFIYCDNNPVNKTDSNGKDAQWWNYASFAAGMAFTAAAIFASVGAASSSSCDPAVGLGAIKYAKASFYLSVCACCCFMVGILGLTNLTTDALMIGLGGCMNVLAEVVGGLEAGEKVNYPGVQVAVGATFAYSLVCISYLAAQDAEP